MRLIEKVIDDFPKYSIDNTGNVFSYCGKSKRKLSQKIDRGYCRAKLHNQGKAQLVAVHRIVAKAFLKNPKNKPEVNHKNGIKTDNRVENLEWVTSSENDIHKHRVLNRPNSSQGRFRAKSHASKPIKQIAKNGQTIKTWSCVLDAAENLNIHGSNIGRVANGKQKTCGGFIWSWA